MALLTLRLPLLSLGFALFTFFGYSTADALGRYLMMQGLGQFQLAFLYELFTLIPILWMTHVNREWNGLHTAHPYRLLFYCFCAVADVACVNYTLTRLPLAECYTLFFTTPLWALVLSAIFLKEYLRPRQIAAVLIGFFGVLIAMNPHIRTFSVAHLTGFGVGFFGALSLIIMRRAGRSDTGAVLLIPVATMQVIMNFAAMGDWQPITSLQMFWVMTIGLVVGTANCSYYLALKHMTAPHFSSLQYTQIFWMLVYGTFMFHEPLTLRICLGLLCVCLAGWMVIIRRKGTPVSEIPLP